MTSILFLTVLVTFIVVNEAAVTPPMPASLKELATAPAVLVVPLKEVTPASSAAGAGSCEMQSPLDIVIVMDNGQYINESTFKTYLIPAIKDFIQGLLPGDNLFGNRFAVILGDSQVTLRWNLDRYTTKSQMFNALDYLIYREGQRATGEGLFLVRASVQPLFRQDVKRIVILFTGIVEDLGIHKASDEAQLLKDSGVLLFVIGVGGGSNKFVLDNLASGPNYRLDVQDYSQLRGAMPQLESRVCNLSKNATLT